jgi:hypothetical protein
MSTDMSGRCRSLSYFLTFLPFQVFLLYLYIYKLTHSMAYGTRGGSMPHSQGISNMPYPELNNFNSSY